MNLTGLTLDCTPAVGSFSAFAYIRAYEVLTLDATGDIILAADSPGWTVLPIADESIRLNTRTNAGPHGHAYIYEVEILEQRIRPEVSAALQRTLGGEFILAIQQGEAWVILCHPLFPFTAEISRAAEAARDDENGQSFLFRCPGLYPPIIRTDWAPTDTPDTQPVLVFTPSQLSPTLWMFTIAGSTLADGTPITQTSTVTISYAIRRLGVLLYTGTIAASANAASGWTALAGSRTTVQFDAEWEAECTGTGYLFTIDTTTLAGIFPDSAVDITITLDPATGSTPALFTLPLS